MANRESACGLARAAYCERTRKGEKSKPALIRAFSAAIPTTVDSVTLVPESRERAEVENHLPREVKRESREPEEKKPR